MNWQSGGRLTQSNRCGVHIHRTPHNRQSPFGRSETLPETVARGLDFPVGMQLEIPSLVRPSTSPAPSSQGDGKPQNVDPDMWGVQDWGSYMDVLDSAEKEALADPEGVSGGPLNTTTLTMVGIGKGANGSMRVKQRLWPYTWQLQHPKRQNFPNLWEPDQRLLLYTLLLPKTSAMGMPLTCLPHTQQSPCIHKGNLIC